MKTLKAEIVPGAGGGFDVFEVWHCSHRNKTLRMRIGVSCTNLIAARSCALRHGLTTIDDSKAVPTPDWRAEAREARSRITGNVFQRVALHNEWSRSTGLPLGILLLALEREERDEDRDYIPPVLRS